MSIIRRNKLLCKATTKAENLKKHNEHLETKVKQLSKLLAEEERRTRDSGALVLNLQAKLKELSELPIKLKELPDGTAWLDARLAQPATK